MSKKVRAPKPRTSSTVDATCPPVVLPRDDPWARTRKNVDLILSDGFMIFLAILMLPIILLPILLPYFSIEIPEDVADMLGAADILILLVFVFEYFLKLFLARDRWAHFKDSWHLLDLMIVLIPMIEVIVLLSMGWLIPTPIFRLLRLARLAAVEGRVVERRTHMVVQTKRPIPKVSTMKIRVIDKVFDNLASGIDLDQMAPFLKNKEQTWIDISGITELDFDSLSNVLGIPEPLLVSKLMEEANPRIDTLEGKSYIFLQVVDPEVPPGMPPTTLTSTGLLIICQGQDMITLSRGDLGLLEQVLKNAKARTGYSDTLVVTVLNNVFDLILDKYKAKINQVECELGRLENLPREEVPQSFLEDTFQFRKEVSRLASHLLHLKEVLASIMSNRVPLEGFEKQSVEMFDIYVDETNYLLETTQNAKENLLSLIDLHINMASFEMNKVMRAIAVITCMTIIPTLVGGMLGMNVVDMPVEIRLWQTVVITAMLMAGIGWVFYKLGWLRA